MYLDNEDFFSKKMYLDNEDTFSNGVVVRKAPDYGVTVNGLGIWPDGEKDDRGYVMSSNYDMTVYYHFENNLAEVRYHSNSNGVVEWILLSFFALIFCCFLLFLYVCFL